MTYAVEKLGLNNVGCLSLTLDSETIKLVPTTDCVLFLSVWHHTVKQHGLEEATQLLRSLWSRASVVMFFDTGEKEMPARYRLPPGLRSNPRQFLEEYLRTNCEGGEVFHLGAHQAFDPSGKSCSRNLYSIRRH